MYVDREVRLNILLNVGIPVIHEANVNWPLVISSNLLLEKELKLVYKLGYTDFSPSAYLKSVPLLECSGNISTYFVSFNQAKFKETDVEK